MPIHVSIDKDLLLNTFRKAMADIKDTRFYSTERGYQGQLVAELTRRLKYCRLHGDPIVEEEYQKNLRKHGIKKRPDIIIHVPYERVRYRSRIEGNFVVVQLKLRSTVKQAKEDFEKLDTMFETLHYLLGIFLNVDSERTHYDRYDGRYRSELHCFAVKLVNGKVVIGEFPTRIRRKKRKSK